MPSARKFSPALHIDTLPVAYRQPDHLSPSISPETRRGEGAGARRRTPSASPLLGPGASGSSPSNEYFPSVASSSSDVATATRTSSNGIRWTKALARIPIPPVLRRYLTQPLVLVITILCLLAVGYRSGFQFSLPSFTSSTPLTSPDKIFTPPPFTVSYEDVLDLPALPVEYEPHFPNLTLPLSIRSPALGALPNRLHEFLARPVLSYEEAKEGMEEGCPLDIANGLVNPDQVSGNAEFWEGVGKVEIYKRRAGIVKSLVRVVERGETVLGTPEMGGRGIVLTGGGNTDTTLRTISLLKHLRSLKNELPIEVFHYPGELTHRNERAQMEELGAELREVTGVGKYAGAWKNFQIKGLALVQSKFREIIYMDSDNIPLRSLDHLFTSPSYLETGAVLWPDLNKDHPHNSIWRVIGDTCSFSKWSFESGQMLIDKAGNGGLNLAALWVASHMMSSPPPPGSGGRWWGGGNDEPAAEEEQEEEREWWFHMCGGDKDTFRWAFRVLDIPWSDPPRWLSLLGFENSYEAGRFCGHTTLQYDLDLSPGGDRELPLFVHGNLLKHIQPGGLGAWNAFTHIKRFKEDAYSNPTLNYAHGYVYRNNMKGMCLDFSWGGLAEERVMEEEREGGIMMIKTDEIAGGPFEGWEQAFNDMGGRIGGWA